MYKEPFDESHKDFLFTKETTCPICGETIKVNQIRYAKLMLKSLEDDFRCMYKGFDDLWYLIWTCPHCGYMNFSDRFNNLEEKTLDKLKATMPRVKSGTMTHVKYNLESVLSDYDQMKTMAETYNMDAIVKARVLQSVTWLKEGIEPEEVINQYYDELVNTLIDLWVHSDPVDGEMELKLVYKVAVIYEKSGDYENAIKFLYKAQEAKNVKKILRKRVDDKLFELRDEYRKLKEKTSA